MNKLKVMLKNNKLLVIVVLAYMILLILMPDKAVLSIKNSMYYIKEMLLIMPVILLLTSLITAWVPRKAIENSLGVNSGMKGSIFAFLLGSFSAGPIYAAFPVCKMLLRKGASLSNIVIILSTWAVIKVPMLLNESKFLGPQFMVVRWILTTLAIFIMGYVITKLVKKSEIPMEDLPGVSEKRSLHVQEEFCMGCGLCSKAAPDYFKIVNKKAIAIDKPINSTDISAINEAVAKCPAKIIKHLD